VVPLPREAVEPAAGDAAPARRESPPDRYWDVYGACWRSCPRLSRGAAAAG
jgi:hypothetical protein